MLDDAHCAARGRPSSSAQVRPWITTCGQDTRLRRGMNKLLQSKFKLGAGVEIVVGPVNCSSTTQTEAE